MVERGFSNQSIPWLFFDDVYNSDDEGMGGGGGGAELDQTPTWAVALVCAVIILISIFLENFLHLVEEWLEGRHKLSLIEALEIIKDELMVLGFISLLLTFTQNYIASICIPLRLSYTMLPCPNRAFEKYRDGEYGGGGEEPRRRLMWFEHRLLGGGPPPECKPGYAPLISLHGLHQLHIFIFFLAVFHVFYGAMTMKLGRLKIKGWKEWEKSVAREEETKADTSSFRLAHQTSFVRSHTSIWYKTPVSFHLACFVRHCIKSVNKADYLTMRHGFVSVHLGPGHKFDFQKYIKRSLEDDFKVIVGISAPLWFLVVIILLLNTDGNPVSYVISLTPIVVILSVGTKLQAVITQMALEIKEKHAVVQGMPLVEVSDKHFWFEWPELVLHLIHFVLFENAFELTYVVWIWYEFGFDSCFHQDKVILWIRIFSGIAVQIICSYKTLPLYALVTQMGSTMKRSIFDEETSKALMNWQSKAKKKRKGTLAEFAGAKTLGAAKKTLSTVKSTVTLKGPPPA